MLNFAGRRKEAGGWHSPSGWGARLRRQCPVIQMNAGLFLSLTKE